MERSFDMEADGIQSPEAPNPPMSVQERLAYLRNEVPEATTPESQTSTEPKITTTEDYFETELDLHLERAILARAYEQQVRNSGQATTIDRRELVLDRPDWEAHFPSDKAPESTEAWEQFVATYPAHMQRALRAMESDHRDLQEAHQDAELMAAVEQEKGQKHEIRQTAILLGSLGREKERCEHANQAMRWQTAVEEAPLTRDQLQVIAANIEETEYLDRLAVRSLEDLSSSEREMVLAERVRLDTLRDRAAIRGGLLETEHMTEIIDRQVANLLVGGRLLLVGETGGAKTALAKHLALETQRLHGVQEPQYEFVSAYGEITAYQLIGKQELVRDEDVTITEFALGAISRAMVNGQPLIIDEINAMPAEISKRLNEILLLKPGDTYTLQENGGQEITIQPGFCIIGTANEKSARYKGVNEISAELRNRFAATTERVDYPDSDVLPGELPTEMYRVAMAFLADKWGDIPLERYGMSPEELVNFLKAAHTSQRLFAEAATTRDAQFIGDDRIRSGDTGLDKEVISPRMVTAILEIVIQSGGQNSLRTALKSYLNGIKEGTSDRAVMTKVLENFQLLDA